LSVAGCKFFEREAALELRCDETKVGRRDSVLECGSPLPLRIFVAASGKQLKQSLLVRWWEWKSARGLALSKSFAFIQTGWSFNRTRNFTFDRAPPIVTQHAHGPIIHAFRQPVSGRVFRSEPGQARGR
jgi:hypothetical protein